MGLSTRKIDQLLDQTRNGDVAAGVSLLIGHRRRLRNLIAYRLHGKLARHVDPSDVVQETLMVAARRLGRYAQDRPVPFYIWLRRLALDRLVKSARTYLYTQKRQNAAAYQELTDDSLHTLAGNLVDTMPTPVSKVIADEQLGRVVHAMEFLAVEQRTVIELRYFERQSVRATAAAMGLSETNVKQLHYRAINQLREMLGDSEVSQ